MTQTLWSQIYLLLPECLWVLTALALLVKLVLKDKKIFKKIEWIETAWLVFLVLISTYLLTELRTKISIFSAAWIVSPLINFIKIGGIIVTSLFLKPLPHMKDHPYKLEYRFLIILALIGLFCTVSSNDLMVLYLGLELQALCLYMIVGLRASETSYSDTSLRYFIPNLIASSLLLYGMSLIYGFSGGYTSFIEIQQAAKYQELGMMMGVFFVLVGLFFKLTVAPFHVGMLSVYQKTTYTQISILETLPKLSIIFIVLRFGEIIFHLSTPMLLIILILALLSLSIGAFGGGLENNLKRLICYSSIYHMGFLLLGFAVPLLNKTGIAVYIITYFPALLGVLILLMFIKKNDLEIETLDDLKGLGHTHPKIALLFSFFLVSLAGIPPFAGFWGKYYILLNVFNKGLWASGIFTILLAAIAAFYYIKIIKIMYFDKQTDTISIHLNGFSHVFVYFLLAIILGFVFFQKWIFPWILKVITV